MENSFYEAGKDDTDEHPLKTLFIARTYTPQNEEEPQQLEEFSLIASTMALMIHVAEADKIVKPEEKERIIGEMTDQLRQRDHERDRLAEDFSDSDREIINRLFDRLLSECQSPRALPTGLAVAFQ